jgi:hypothetical protein
MVEAVEYCKRFGLRDPQVPLATTVDGNAKRWRVGTHEIIGNISGASLAATSTLRPDIGRLVTT